MVSSLSGGVSQRTAMYISTYSPDEVDISHSAAHRASPKSRRAAHLLRHFLQLIIDGVPHVLDGICEVLLERYRRPLEYNVLLAFEEVVEQFLWGMIMQYLRKSLPRAKQTHIRHTFERQGLSSKLQGRAFIQLRQL